ncbi:MAG: RHS repeat protein, partial [Acidobacteria bacterium]|nr:RHS repeat protein [Acidobacteriota bacterium]
MRTIAGFVCWTAMAAAQTVNIPLVIQMSCDATYRESGSTGSLNGTCSGLVQPYGMGSMTLALTGRISETSPVSGIGGGFTFTFSGGMGFEAVVDGAAARPSGTSGMVILTSAAIRSGSGTMNGAGGSLSLSLDGVSEREGMARIRVDGTGLLTGPGLRPMPAVPAGPGPLGVVTEAGGAACGDPVAVTNGNMYHRFVDLAVEGRSFPIVLTRTYNSQAAAVDSPFGFGWTHSYREALIASGTAILLESGSGSVIRFTPLGGGYSSASAPELQLTRDGTGYTLRSGDGTLRKFDNGGRLLSLADRNGNGQTYSYDSAGRLTAIADGAGAVVTFTYNGAGRITAVQDHAGRRASYEYDSAGNLVSAVGVGQQRTSFEYAGHTMKRMTPAGEGPMNFEYSADGRAAANGRQGGSLVEFVYGQGQTVLKEGDAATAYEFNAAGQVTGTVLPDGATKRQGWNDAGRIAWLTDELGHRTSYTHDAAGRVLTKTDPLGNTIRFGYEEGSGRMTGFIDAAGNRTGS